MKHAEVPRRSTADTAGATDRRLLAQLFHPAAIRGDLAVTASKDTAAPSSADQRAGAILVERACDPHEAQATRLFWVEFALRLAHMLCTALVGGGAKLRRGPTAAALGALDVERRVGAAVGRVVTRSA